MTTDQDATTNKAIMKRWRFPEPGDERDWFETTVDETLRHTEGNGHWQKGTVMDMLSEGTTVHTPYAEYKMVAVEAQP